MIGHDELRAVYAHRYSAALLPLAEALNIYLKQMVEGKQLRIDQISVRAKEIDRFMDKAFKSNDDGTLKYEDPLEEITDQLGARIVTYYVDDVERVCAVIRDYFGKIEERELKPERINQFDYEGRHFTLFVPSDIKAEIPPAESPEFFELQIKTLFQHAWGQANHDIFYKPRKEATEEQQRLNAYAASQAWGADTIFNQLARDLL